MNASHLIDIHRLLKQEEVNCHNNYANQHLKGNYCKYFFDDLMCWPSTESGKHVFQNCTNNYIKSTKQGFARQQCDENGHWFVLKLENVSRVWTNYSECGEMFINRNRLDEASQSVYQKWLPILKNVTQFGYLLSIMCLITSISIFILIKRLQCARNRLHTHLFISFVMRALMSLVKNTFLSGNDSWLCKVVFTTRFYFITSNYMFLLMEGAYLHNLMFLNLFSESGVRIYCLAGWALPLFSLIPWIILKMMYENVHCWSKKINKYISLLLDLPVGLSVIINFIIFTIIMKIVFVKLNSIYLEQRKIKYRKLLRSTLILVPLFGIPYTLSYLLLYCADYNQTFEILLLFFDQTFIAFHGLFASLIYCLLNNEVQIEIKRKYNSFKDRNNKEFRRSRTISHTTQMALNDELQEFQPQNISECDGNGKKISTYF